MESNLSQKNNRMSILYLNIKCIFIIPYFKSMASVKASLKNIGCKKAFKRHNKHLKSALIAKLKSTTQHEQMQGIQLNYLYLF